MAEDTEGFSYPIKNKELCNNCDLCKNVCPNVNKNKIENSDVQFMSKAYLAIHNDEEVLYSSSSGGVFSAIVQSFCKDDFIVFGVEFDKDFNVVHTCADTIKDTEKYRKSKYIQSDISDSYKQAEIFLKESKRVLFTGTPCQIAGLRLYLKKECENLFCVDFVCHGVPSQKVFNEYKEYLKNIYSGPITSFTFRHKTHVNNVWQSRNIKAEINGETIINDSNEDIYLRGYHEGLFYRPSCYECKYANPNRVSDITMGDFWSVKKLYPKENPHKGVSAILINSTKAANLLVHMKTIMSTIEVDKKNVVEHTGQLRAPTPLNPKRDEFFNSLGAVGFDRLIEKYCKRKSIARRITSEFLPENIKHLIRRVIK